MLNRIREGKQTEEDLTVLKSRSIACDDPEYKTLKHELHLFPCNAAVDIHNRKMYDSVTTEKADIECFDTVLGDDSGEVKGTILEQLKGRKTNDTGNLSETLKVAVGLCYDTTHNVSVMDGICNGTPCILRKIHYMEKQKAVPSCLWVEFVDKDVGRKTRREYNHYYKKFQRFQKSGHLYGLLRERSCFDEKQSFVNSFP